MTLQKIGLIFLLLKKESLLDHIDVNKLETISRVNFSTPTFGDHLLVMIELSETVDKLENVIQREQRINGIKITTDDLIDNTYLNEEIKLCLTKCPFLTIK